MTRLEKLKDLLTQTPGDGFLLFALAKEYEGLQDDDQALVYYQQLHNTQPDYVGLYYHLGKLYERRADVQAAWDTYTTGMTVARTANDQHALSELAGARMELGDEDDFE